MLLIIERIIGPILGPELNSINQSLEVLIGASKVLNLSAQLTMTFARMWIHIPTIQHKINYQFLKIS